jgi:hypothetical protein
LVSPNEPKKKFAGMALFMKGTGKSRTTRVVDLAEHEKAAKEEVIQIRKPTKKDYEDVP